MESHRRGWRKSEGGERVANPQNLEPARTKSEARERGRNGGIKSGESRRKKKTMRERAQLLLDCKFKDEDMLEAFKALGVKTQGLTIADAMLLGQMVGAITGKGGDPRAFKAILDLVEPDGEQDASIDQHNARMETITDLLNAPKANRNINDFENEDGDTDG
jgi:hypothetical protein